MMVVLCNRTQIINQREVFWLTSNQNKYMIVRSRKL